MTDESGPSKESLRSVGMLIHHSFGLDRFIDSIKRVSGGCIADAFQIVLDDGTALFLKIGGGQHNGIEAESKGLEALRATNTIAIPKVIAAESRDSGGILILEWIQQCPPRSDFWPRFGQQLAQLHLANQTIDQFGFSQDNLIGTTKQPNRWASHWPEFFAEFRLAFQADLALEQGLIDTTQRNDLDRLIDKLPDLLASNNLRPALLHGDLWNGNFLCDTNQTPVIFDPAVYYGHHECEFGMTTLFGGFDSTFYEAYHSVIPKDDGTTQRVEIYQLYHLLNHLNLFGQSYWSACQAIISKYS